MLTIKVDEYLEGGWNEYDYNISDHRPVAISFHLNSSTDGDLNGDGSVNIQDIILIVNIIMDDGEYTEYGDMNFDGYINILDVVTLANIILNN